MEQEDAEIDAEMGEVRSRECTIGDLIATTDQLNMEKERSDRTIAGLKERTFYAEDEIERLNRLNKGLLAQVHELQKGSGGGASDKRKR